MIIILQILFLLLPSSSSAAAAANLTFNLTSFNPNNHDLNYSGEAIPSTPVVQLTRNQQDKAMNSSTGRVTYPKLFHLWDKHSGNLADFTTRFSFIIDSQKRSVRGDGLAFFLAPEGFKIPSVQEGSGMGLVSVDETMNSTLNPFVAVEFDTYKNGWDPIGDHVGININSMVSVKNVSWSSLVRSGEMNRARVSYNASAKKLRVSFSGFKDDGSVFVQRISLNVDLRKYLPEWVIIGFSASTGTFFEIHTLHSWDFSSNLWTDERIIGPISSELSPSGSIGPETINARNPKRLVLGISLSLGLSFCGVIGWFFFFCYRKNRLLVNKDQEMFGTNGKFENIGPKKFAYKQLAIATKNFAEEEMIGKGGFGEVYRGFLNEVNSYVAVKKVLRGSTQGVKEYAAEVKTISRLRHRNLVQLIGWCHEDQQLLLVYEFMPNGSLDSHLFKGHSLLTWAMRYNIARGLASALLYLHEEWEQCVLHRDIKSSNVMLDSGFNTKLGDFGLARLVDHEKASQTTILAGTMGYMAPECVLTGKVGKGSDVYSFGIVALELASGKKSINPRRDESYIRLVDHVWEMYGRQKLSEAVDSKLGEDFDEGEMERLIMAGLWCVHPDPNLRPTIKQVIQVLDFEAPLPNLPETMPVATYSVAPITMSAFWCSLSFDLSGCGKDHIVCSSLSNDANSSKLTNSSSASSSSSLLLHTR